MRPLRMPGEQSYQNTRSDNNNWNGTLTANYRIGKAHTFTFNHVINAFRRSNQSLLNEDSEANAIPKETRKNISGLSYRLMPTEHGTCLCSVNITTSLSRGLSLLPRLKMTIYVRPIR